MRGHVCSNILTVPGELKLQLFTFLRNLSPRKNRFDSVRALLGIPLGLLAAAAMRDCLDLKSGSWLSAVIGHVESPVAPKADA